MSSTIDPIDYFINDCVLMQQTFPEPEWIIPGIIPQGLTLFAGKPKIGKSWWALQIASDLAEQGDDVLYLALEDPRRRLQERLNLVTGKDTGTGHLTLCGSGVFPKLDQGGITTLSEWLIRCPTTKFIIIDTLAMVKPDSKGNNGAYADDYKAMQSLKLIADRFKIGIMVVHHVRKFNDPDDPFANVSGTNALGGCADTILVLDRAYSSNNATLYIRGRDTEIPEREMAWDPDIHRWNFTDSIPQQVTSKIGQAILELLRNCNIPMSQKDICCTIIENASRSGEVVTPGGISSNLSRMKRSGALLHTNKMYSLPSYIYVMK